MTVSTSKNLTYLGIATILAAVANAAVGYLSTKTIDFGVLVAAIMGGIGMIMAKGAASTGGTVDAGGKPVVDPAPPVPAP